MALNMVPETMAAVGTAAKDVADKAEVKLEGGRWERFESSASTDVPQEWNRSRQSTCSSFGTPGDANDGPWISEEAAPQVGDASQAKDWRSLTMELRGALAEAWAAEAAATRESMCPAGLTSGTLDWRPLTVTLRRALADTQKAEEEESAVAGTTATKCPDTLTTETQDWRPLATTLRGALAKAQEAEALKAEETAIVSTRGARCPETVTTETQDWRPLATTLRRALAEAREVEASHQLMTPAGVVARVKETAQAATGSTQSPEAVDTAGAEAGLCPAAITAETQDWRRSTSVLRAALAGAKAAEAGAAPACPEHIAAETLDWRPLATSLRGALARALAGEAAAAPACPECITAETEDWRPLTVALRTASAHARESEGVEVSGSVSRLEPKAEGSSMAMVFVLALFVAVTLACRSLLPVVGITGSV